MLSLLSMMAAAAQLEAPQPTLRAIATVSVRIERPAKAGREEWDRVPESRKSEVVVQDKDGRPVLLRLVEYQ